jgi:hypothetical protein
MCDVVTRQPTLQSLAARRQMAHQSCTEACGTWHSASDADAPAVQQLAEGRQPRWTRVDRSWP